jgi:general stress protein 26
VDAPGEYGSLLKEVRVDTRAMLDAMERVLEDAKVAILATVDVDGRPHVRWMTPTTVRGREGYLYAVTSPEFGKVSDASGNSAVEWQIQTKSLNEIVTVRGEMRIVNNAAAHAEVLEAIGGNLGVFWKLNPDESKLVVLETEISEIIHFIPTKGERTLTKMGGSRGES